MTKKTYTVPTHLKREDQILSLGLISFNARQLLLLIITGALTYNFATNAIWLNQTLVGLSLHYLLVTLFASTMALLIFGKTQGRGFDLWLLILFHYWSSPSRFTWQSFRVAAGERTRPEITEEGKNIVLLTQIEEGD